ncbi:MAG TPA: hypothetical protein PKL56_15975 [Cyclobacteriaceae bacterium]|nr:hypothetical protein [Cyclobacteriaceae bacterium]HMX88035.1 hypothetical protein [Saprospiraceae bacterium]HMX00867.1 hypothetical protein [Cyclobacteriaceae bacterium]HMY93671.1 hypothetical protein [Cyclobacteriaceae bacterium]HNA12895.1 hypothetical protein [Cyclobacteriaceae bacterium]
MDKVEQVGSFLKRVASDASLGASHVSFCTAVCTAWIENGLNNPFNISRRRLMASSKIKSTSTYHRILNDLKALKYFEYVPSFHPGKGSQVLIVTK